MKFRHILIASFLFFGIAMNSTADTPGNTAAFKGKFDRDKLRVQLREYIFQQYTDDKGTHVESALSALGALSGFAVQYGLRHKFVVEQKLPESKVFLVVKAKNGDNYYFGQLFDQFLLGVAPGRISVWSLVGGGAQKAGAKRFPDIASIAKNNAERVGAENYGVPDPISGYPIGELPLIALQRHWKSVKDTLEATGAEPVMWGWEIALVAQDIIVQSKEDIPPDVAAQIVMEAAIPMSKIDPRKIDNF